MDKIKLLQMRIENLAWVRDELLNKRTAENAKATAESVAELERKIKTLHEELTPLLWANAPSITK